MKIITREQSKDILITECIENIMVLSKEWDNAISVQSNNNGKMKVCTHEQAGRFATVSSQEKKEQVPKRQQAPRPGRISPPAAAGRTKAMGKPGGKLYLLCTWGCPSRNAEFPASPQPME